MRRAAPQPPEKKVHAEKRLLLLERKLAGMRRPLQGPESPSVDTGSPLRPRAIICEKGGGEVLPQASPRRESCRTDALDAPEGGRTNRLCLGRCLIDVTGN